MKMGLLGTDVMTLVGACRNFTETPKKNLCQTMQEQSRIYVKQCKNKAEFMSNNAITKQNLCQPKQ